MARRIAVLGGGITGLTAAYRLTQAATEQRPLEVQLWEASDRVGGNLRIERVGNVLVDAGPDGFVATKPHAAQLCRDLGLGDQLIETRAENRRTYMVHRGRLVPFPEGVMLTAPTRLGPMVRTPLISLRGKLRMAIEPLLPPAHRRDESIGAFVRRRLGNEAVEVFAEPVMAGIHVGDVESLSIEATFPQLVEMERSKGGLIRGAMATRRARGDGRDVTPPSTFLSLRDGMGSLPDVLMRALPLGTVRLRMRAVAMARHPDGGWQLTDPEGHIEVVDAVVIALPHPSTAKLLETVAPEASALVGDVPRLSSAAVYLAYPREAITHALDATGFIVPRSEGLAFSAATWLSSKWPGRAPDDTALIRVFFGGARALEQNAMSDEALVQLGHTQLAPIIGAKSQPSWHRVYRWIDGNPQMLVGHTERMKRVQQGVAALGTIAIAGGGYDGVGIPDCVKQAEAAARAVLTALSGSAA